MKIEILKYVNKINPVDYTQKGKNLFENMTLNKYYTIIGESATGCYIILNDIGDELYTHSQT